MKKFLPLVALLTVCSGMAWSQTFTVDTLLNNGSKANRINLVFLAEGYTSSQQSQFVTDVNAVLTQFFATPPLSYYKPLFNVYAVHVVSQQSGANHPGTATDCYTASPTVPVMSGVNNYFGATFDYGGTHRLLYCPNTSAITSVLSANTPWYDKAMILVNTPYYGGSGGTYSIGSTNTQSAEIMIHEFGHSFAGLADEYGGTYCTAAEKPNVASTITPLKWQAWVNTTVPTPAFTNCGSDGAYVGANYCNSGWYRPECDCKMKTLGQPLCSVCKQQYVKTIMTYVNLIDMYAPSSTAITLNSGSQTFSASVLQPTTNTVKRVWTLDGNVVSTNTNSYTVNSANLSAAVHSLVLTVQDTTSLSKDALPSGSVTWTITKTTTGAVTTLSTFNAVCANSPSFTLSGGLPLGGVYSGTGVTNGVFYPATAGAGTFTITYTVAGVAAAQPITVKALPTITGTSSASVCQGNSATLSKSGATTYSWVPTTGLNSATASSVVATPTSTIIYTVTGTTNGCSATATVPVTVNALPSISTSGNASVCSGSSATLTASGGNTYAWTPSTGLNIATGASVVATPAATTVYTVTGTNASGCSTSASATVTVGTINVTTTANTSICTGNSASLTASGATSYTWTPATGLNVTTGSNVVANPTSTTTYSVTAVSGSCSTVKTIVLTVSAAPILSTSANQTVCGGNSASLTVSGASTYTWAPATGLNTTTGANVVATPTTSVTYTVTGNGAGCSATKNVSVAVNPAVNVTLNTSAATVCNGSSTSLIASGAATYAWAPSTGLNATSGANVNAAPTVNTTYTVTGSSNGCMQTKTVTVSVNTLSMIVSSSATGVCSGSSATLTASGATSYMWSPATNLNASSGSSVTATPTVSTTYTITGTNNGCTGTVTKAVAVSPSFTLSSSSNASVCPGTSTALTASGATSYTWSPATGLNMSTGANVTSTPTSTVIYTITGTSGYCTRTKTVSVTVLAKPTLSTTTTAASCSGAATGAVNLAVSGVSGTFTYYWNNNATTQNLSNVTAGTYTVTVSVAGGCANNTSATVAGGTCGAPTVYSVLNLTATGATMKWNKIPCAVKYKVHYKASTATIWTSAWAVDTTMAAAGLASGTVYQYQVESFCNVALTDSSGYGAVQSFTTGGGCNVPTGFLTTGLTTQAATMSWAAVSGAWGYHVRIRKGDNTDSWVTYTVQAPATSYSVAGLLAGTSYKWQVWTMCDAAGTSVSAYSSTIYFSTYSTQREEEEANGTNATTAAPVITVYPNPVETQLTIGIEQPSDAQAVIELYNVTGQQLRAETVNLVEGTNAIGWNVDGLPAGTYLLNVKQASGIVSRQVIKQ